jgi:rubrerythrin
MVIECADQLLSAQSRRSFLRAMAVGGSAVLLPGVFAACGDDDDGTTGVPGVKTATLDLAGDTGVLNYVFALEQLEAAFYVRVIQESGVAGFNAIERRLLQDIRNHEFIHREALRALLGSARLPELRIDHDFDGTDFRSRSAILEKARTFEDLGISAYNNATRYLTTAANVTLFGKIVSVEARHSAIVRDLLDDTSGNSGRLFAGDDIVDENGLDNKDQPTTFSDVLGAARSYIASTITTINQPA